MMPNGKPAPALKVFGLRRRNDGTSVGDVRCARNASPPDVELNRCLSWADTTSEARFGYAANLAGRRESGRLPNQ
jgi:hypothetical protein